MYRTGDKYGTKKGRTYFFILHPGSPDVKFNEAIQTYANALINTTGGIIVFGVDEREHVKGFDLDRRLEDIYKCSFDRAIRNFRPTIHPHQYRMDVLYLNYHRAIFEIRISAGDPTEIYENAKKEMYIVKDKMLYGPLFPCEITQIVLEKYKEEVAALINCNPCSEGQTTSVEPEQEKMQKSNENEDTECDGNKAKRIKITWP